MIEEGLAYFRGRKVLLLQGPPGPFFRRLAADLRNVGAQVYKVNFNGGDVLFYPKEAISYQGTLAAWPEYCRQLLLTHRIDLVLLFGDCRPVHQDALKVARALDIDTAVFEEGYVRPDYITLERSGVNAHSHISQNPNFYRRLPRREAPPTHSVGNSFAYAMASAMLYNGASRVLSKRFPHYGHHRSLTISEGMNWILSGWRKLRYRIKEAGIAQHLEGPLARRYFLVPLQVHNDAQISVHSSFQTVEEFITYVMTSFARHADPAHYLVIKHHPMDRGYTDYTRCIEALARELCLGERVLYIHDQHLPPLLKSARGVVVINSTVGLSALYHKVPVKACGEAIYALRGLASTESLERFWHEQPPVDPELFEQFRNYLIQKTQLNGNFYRRLPIAGSHSGIYWR